MATKRKTDAEEKPRRPPATTPEARENQMVSLAYDVAEKQMREGTASSQVLTQFLKLGTRRDHLERHKLSLENELLVAKKEQIASAVKIEELYGQALDAMRSYKGQDPIEEDFDD